MLSILNICFQYTCFHIVGLFDCMFIVIISVALYQRNSSKKLLIFLLKPIITIAALMGELVVQSLSSVWLFVTPWTAACQDTLSFTISWCLLKLMSIESVMPSNYFILCHPLLLLPSIFPSIRVFSNESVLCIRWPKYWSFTFTISPSNEYSGLISFRIDWFDLLAVQGNLKRLFNTTVKKHQFFGPQSSLWSICHTHTLLLEKP